MEITDEDDDYDDDDDHDDIFMLTALDIDDRCSQCACRRGSAALSGQSLHERSVLEAPEAHPLPLISTDLKPLITVVKAYNYSEDDCRFMMTGRW